jgi:hypothetical protein
MFVADDQGALTDTHMAVYQKGRMVLVQASEEGDQTGVLS